MAMSDALDEAALDYHRSPTPGKLSIVATKPLAHQRDLALAYSPGVAAACLAIVEDENEASSLTIRANLVAVISNGTAVLGLGNIGPLAAKPVMEGKAVLFKKFAGIDVFDIEVNETDPQKLIEIIASLEPTFGAINLEDIKAPECFVVEKELRKRMGIPVFHDDQHGTAIVTGAALINGLRVVGKSLDEISLVSTGGGAAGIACLDLMVSMGLKADRVTLVDRVGVVYRGRKKEMDPHKERYAIDTKARTLDDVIDGADAFLGLSAPGVLTPDMVKRMAERPLILALANPNPEIDPKEAMAARPDVVMATGRSDYPNQVNNVLCFPFIFRGALDCGATIINEEMKLACVKAIADLAMAESSEIVALAYGDDNLKFGPEYLIPKPFDPRLVVEIAPAIAKAAMDSGVATRPIEDFDAYKERLGQFVFRSGLLMKPVFEHARQAPKRLVYAEGEDERVLRAVQTVVDEGIAEPILVGRPDVVEARIERLGLRVRAGREFELVNPENDPRYKEYWELYHQLMERKGVSPDDARTIVRTNTTVIAALMLRRGEANAMLCGTYGQYAWHLRYIMNVIGLEEGRRDVSALSIVILPKGTILPVRYPRVAKSDRRGARRNDRAVGRTDAALRDHAENRFAFPFGLRLGEHAGRRQVTRSGAHSPRTVSRPRGGRGNAGRRGTQREYPPAYLPQLPTHGDRQPSRHADVGSLQHLLQHAQGPRRRTPGGTDPGRRREAGSRPDPFGHGARHR